MINMICIECEKETKQQLTLSGQFVDVYTCLNLIVDTKNKSDRVCNNTTQLSKF